MLSLAARLDTYLRAQGVAILGVSVGDEENRATWKVFPANLQGAAQPHIDAFVIPDEAMLLDEDADRDLNAPAVRAMMRETYDLVPAYAGKPTLLEFFARIKARYKALT